jgi:hypothetical protein
MPRVVQERPREREHDGIDAAETELAQPGLDILPAMPRDERHERDLVSVPGRQGGQ